MQAIVPVSLIFGHIQRYLNRSLEGTEEFGKTRHSNQSLSRVVSRIYQKPVRTTANGLLLEISQEETEG